LHFGLFKISWENMGITSDVLLDDRCGTGKKQPTLEGSGFPGHFLAMPSQAATTG